MSSFISKFLNFIFPPVTHSCSCMQEINEMQREYTKQVEDESEEDEEEYEEDDNLE
ncbi:MAG: hypothetical protein SNI70_08235 [Rikenellaceae bacterium]